MKFCWVVLLVLAGVVAPAAAHGQAALYGEFTVTDLHNKLSTDYLSGASVGVLIDGPKVKRIQTSADLKGRFVGGSGERLDSVTIGPRFSVPFQRFGGFSPYGEFMLGFARFNGNAVTAAYNGAANNSTTDFTIQVNAGLTKKVSSHFDGTADYSYSQYYAYGGQYNPKSFSIGAIYHFAGR